MHKDLDHHMSTLATGKSKSGETEKSLMPSSRTQDNCQSHVKLDCTHLKIQGFENYF